MSIIVSKETRLNIRVKPDFKEDLEAVAEYHGLTVSSYVHSVLVKKIREEKETDPGAFKTKKSSQTVSVNNENSDAKKKLNKATERMYKNAGDATSIEELNKKK